MDASRQNSPSRKSRFRAHGPSTHRPAAPTEEATPYAEPGAAAYEGEEMPADEAAVVESDVHHAVGTVPNYALEANPEYAEVPVEEYAAVAEAAPAVTYREAEDKLPAGLRLTRSTERVSDNRRRVGAWPAILSALACLVAGATAGYFLHSNSPNATLSGGSSAPAAILPPTLPLTPQILADVDAGFDAVKQGRFADARQRFNDLADKRPTWPSMRIEAARASLYQHDFEGAQHILNSILRAKPNADAEFLSGLLEMTTQTYDKSEAAFARAVALDPARPDIFYFWGECLRREGKPQDAAIKFRQALIRNQYETTEGLYTLKLWLSEIQADHEGAKGVNDKIDVDLASGHPSGPALFAAAARDLKAGRPADAGAHVAQAQKVMEPAVFKVILQDPIFLQENFRPELTPFYKP